MAARKANNSFPLTPRDVSEADEEQVNGITLADFDKFMEKKNNELTQAEILERLPPSYTSSLMSSLRRRRIPYLLTGHKTTLSASSLGLRPVPHISEAMECHETSYLL